MICIGELKEVKTKFENMVDTYFPGDLSLQEIVDAANEYERVLYKR